MTDHPHLAAEVERKQRTRRAARLDLIVLAVLLVVGYTVAAVYDLNEAWLVFAEDYEDWELDELPVALALCSLMVLAFAVRRWFDASSEARRVGELNRRVVQEVAGHRQAAAAVREREARLAKLIDTMHDGLLVIDAGGDATYVNDRFCAITGYDRDVVLEEPAAGLTVFAPLPELSAPAADMARTRRELRLTRADGTDFEAIVTVTPLADDLGVPGGRYVVIADMSDLRRAERLGRLSEARLNAFFTEAPAGLAMWDDELRLRQVNATMAGWGGLAIEHYAGRRLRDIVPDLAAEIEPVLERVIATGRAATNLRITVTESRVPLTKQHWLASVFPLPGAAGGIGGAGAVLVDVTEWQETEHRLRQAQKMEALGKLTGGVAHDFNNLLAIIAGNLELLIEDLDGAPQLQDTANAARSAAERGADLTDRLLAYARSQELQPTAVDVAAMMADMQSILVRTIGEGIRLRVDVADDVWPCHADRNELDNAILNLVVNARDAMKGEGTVAIRAENTLVGPGTAQGLAELAPGEYVRIAIIDEGSGMSPEVRRRAFEPFFTTAAPGRGTGLGLSTVYGFAQQSGGVARIISTEGRGTTVELYLPQAREEPCAAAAAPHPADGLRAARRLLVVEDNADVRAMITRMLSRLGHEVTTVASGDAALTAVDGGAPLDALVTDLGLGGGMDGRQLAEAVLQRRPGMPVLVVSGYAGDDDTGALPEGTEILRKPFTRAELVAALDRLLPADAAVAVSAAE